MRHHLENHFVGAFDGRGFVNLILIIGFVFLSSSLSGADLKTPVYDKKFNTNNTFSVDEWFVSGDVSLIPNPSTSGDFCVASVMSEKSVPAGPGRPYKAFLKPRKSSFRLTPGGAYILNIKLFKKSSLGIKSKSVVEVIPAGRLIQNPAEAKAQSLVIFRKYTLPLRDIDEQSAQWQGFPFSVPDKTFRSDGYDFSIALYADGATGEAIYIEEIQIVESGASLSN